MDHQDNNDCHKTNTIDWRGIVIILLLVIAVVLTIFKIRKAQKDLRDYLEDKKQFLEEALKNIEQAQKDKQRLLLYKQVANVLLRVIMVVSLASINLNYIKFYFSGARIPDVLSAITDFNAILLLSMGLLVFLRYGSFIELKSVYDAVQNSVLNMLFNRRAGAIDAMLKSNIQSRDSILSEIAATENAIKENEGSLNFQEEAVILSNQTDRT